MQQNYSSTIKDHYRNPRNTGKLSDYTHTAENLNPLCGDEIRVYLKLSAQGGSASGRKILDISHETRGCMIAVAAASVVSKFAKGKKLAEIKKLDVFDVAKLLNVSVSPAREQCGVLFLQALRTSLAL